MPISALNTDSGLPRIRLGDLVRPLRPVSPSGSQSPPFCRLRSLLVPPYAAIIAARDRCRASGLVSIPQRELSLFVVAWFTNDSLVRSVS